MKRPPVASCGSSPKLHQRQELREPCFPHHSLAGNGAAAGLLPAQLQTKGAPSPPRHPHLLSPQRPQESCICHTLPCLSWRAQESRRSSPLCSHLPGAQGSLQTKGGTQESRPHPGTFPPCSWAQAKGPGGSLQSYVPGSTPRALICRPGCRLHRSWPWPHTGPRPHGARDGDRSTRSGRKGDP